MDQVTVTWADAAPAERNPLDREPLDGVLVGARATRAIRLRAECRSVLTMGRGTENDETAPGEPGAVSSDAGLSTDVM